MSDKTPVVLSLEGNLKDGQMLVVCGQDICTQDVPNVKQTVIERPYAVYKTIPTITPNKANQKAMGSSALALILAIWALKRTFKKDRK